MSEQLYVRIRGRVHGPLDFERIQSLAQRGQLSRIHEISRDGKNWQPASSMPEVFEKKQAAVAASAEKLAEKQIASANPFDGQPDTMQAMSMGVVAAPQQQKDWHYTAGGLQAGPITAHELGTLIRSGAVSQQDLLWRDPMEQWTEAKYVPEFSMLFAAAQQVNMTPAASGTNQEETRDPNRIYPSGTPPNPVAMALCSFLLLGLGQIMMGQTGKGVLILLSILLTCGVFIFVTPIIAPLDAYLIAKKLEAGNSVGKWEWF